MKCSSPLQCNNNACVKQSRPNDALGRGARLITPAERACKHLTLAGNPDGVGAKIPRTAAQIFRKIPRLARAQPINKPFAPAPPPAPSPAHLHGATTIKCLPAWPEHAHAIGGDRRHPSSLWRSFWHRSTLMASLHRRRPSRLDLDRGEPRRDNCNHRPSM